MQIREIDGKYIELIADEGKKLTDGNGYYSRVFLSVLDSIDNYTEVDDPGDDEPEEEENE